MGASRPPRRLNLLLLTESVPDHSHGTGALLARLLDDDALFNVASLVHIASERTRSPQLKCPTVTSVSPVPSSPWGNAIKRVLDRWNWRTEVRGHGRWSLYGRSRFSPLPAACERTFDDCKIALAIIHSNEGLDFVLHVLPAISTRIPLVLWFMDYDLQCGFLGRGRFQNIRHRVLAWWAWNEPMAQRISQDFGVPASEIGIHADFLPAVAPGIPTIKEEGPTEAVMIGNVWNRHTLPYLGRTWNIASGCLQTPSMLPNINWYGPAHAHERLANLCTIPACVAYRGHLEDSALANTLRRASFAVLPFDPSPVACTSYSRYSIPSRIADYLAAGLPMFAIAPGQSPTAQLVLESGAGIVVSGFDSVAVAKALVEFVMDGRRRAEMSNHALNFAHQHLQAGTVRAGLHARLTRLIRAAENHVDEASIPFHE